MNDCPRGDIRDVLPDLLHDRLGGAARAEAERHVSACAACAEELQLLRGMQRALRKTDAVDVSRVAAAVQRGVGPRPSAERPGARRRINWRVAAAAAVLVTGGLTFAVVEHASMPTRGFPSPPTHAGQIAAGPAAGPGLMFGGGVADLSDGDIERLLQDVDSLSGLPAAEPVPVLHGVSAAEPL